MTIEEKIRVLAKAIMELADRSASEADYDGEQTVTTGVYLDFETSGHLREILKEPQNAGD